MPDPARRATLIYDGRCSLCRGAVEWIRARDAQRAFDFVPCQTPDLEVRFPGVSRAACEREVTLVSPDGSRCSGAEALPQILRRLPGWRRLAPFLSWRVLLPLNRRLYHVIARHRPRDANEFGS